MNRCLLAVAALLLSTKMLPAADGSHAVAVTMREFVECGRVAGSVTLVAQDGKILNLDCVGRADMEANRPMRPDTLFRIASMTKLITATAVMIAVDEGRIVLDDPVSKYLPEFAATTVADGGKPKQPLTVRLLMTHTSGVDAPDKATLPENPSLADTVAGIARRPLLFEPGTKFSYGLGLSVAARIVEVVMKTPFDEFVEERICKPLGLKDTTYYPNAEQQTRIATLYRRDKETKQLAATATPFVASGTEAKRPAPGPSGGMYSTAVDYFHFLQMILEGGEFDGRRIVSESAVAEMTKLQTGEVVPEKWPYFGWGLGWAIVRKPGGYVDMLAAETIGHGGAFGTVAWLDRERGGIVILMIARSDMSSYEESDIRATFQREALRQFKR